MSYDLSLSRFFRSGTRKLADGVQSIGEGYALVAKLEDGVMVVAPATGAADEVFVGTSINQQAWPDLTRPMNEIIVLDKDGVGTLSRDPVVTQVAVFKNDGTGKYDDADVSVGGAGVDKRQIKVKLPAPAAGETAPETTSIKVQYQFSPSTVEALTTVGGTEPGLGLTATTGHTGVIYGGDVYTSCYDVTDDWSKGGKVYLGEGGRFTLKSGGTQVLNAVILQVPQFGGNQYLGLSFNY